MAVERVREGERASSVICSYGFNRTTIYKWLTAASSPGKGLKALRSRPATGRPRTLIPRQEKQVFAWVNGKDPRQYGLDFGLWTRAMIASLIEQKFAVKLGLTAVGELLANAQLFVKLLKQMMRNRTKAVHLVVDGLPAHKTKLVKEYVASTAGRLTLHFLPGYAPELNPDELVWSHVKRTGVSRTPLSKGEKLREKIEMQLAAIKKMPHLVRAFFKPPSVAYITD